jgi:hypothetical protein
MLILLPHGIECKTYNFYLCFSVEVGAVLLAKLIAPNYENFAPMGWETIPLLCDSYVNPKPRGSLKEGLFNHLAFDLTVSTKMHAFYHRLFVGWMLK